MKDSEKIEVLRAALIAGEQSGEPQPFNNAAFLKRIHDKHGIDENGVRLQSAIDKGLASAETDRTIAEIVMDGREARSLIP